jgi:hypothetical protein
MANFAASSSLLLTSVEANTTVSLTACFCSGIFGSLGNLGVITRTIAQPYKDTFALAGGAAYSNNVTVDGLDDNDDRSARERFQPSLEAVEEVQVITNQFSAEYGRTSGGRVNLRTRSGSNRLRGRLFYFFRDKSLDANT